MSERHRNERQFSTAVALVKDGIPERLRIGGHNPLTLLYGALSKEVHEGTDEDCLAIATSVREVLTELVNRLSEVLRAKAAVDRAVTALLNTRKK